MPFTIFLSLSFFIAFVFVIVSVYPHDLCQAVYNPDSFHFHSVRKHSAFLHLFILFDIFSHLHFIFYLFSLTFSFCAQAFCFFTCSYSLISFLTRSSSSSCFFWAAQSKSPQDESFCHHRNNSPWWRTGWCCNWTFAHHFHRLPGPQSWSWFSCSGCGDVRQNLLFSFVIIIVIMIMIAMILI